MRTTLDIDADLLTAARELASLQRRSLGAVISELGRRGLHATALTASEPAAELYGFLPQPANGVVVSNQQINQLRDELGT